MFERGAARLSSGWKGRKQLRVFVEVLKIGRFENEADRA